MENTQVDKKSFQNLNSGEVDVRRKILRHILDSFDSEKEQTRIKDLDNSSYHFINKMKEVMKRDLLNISMEIRESVDLLKYSQKSLEYFKVSGSKHVFAVVYNLHVNHGVCLFFFHSLYVQLVFS